MTVSAAMSEIVRVGGWALRGLGYQFGVAERGIPFIAWAEAAHGQVIRSLRLTEESTTASARRPAPQRRLESETSWLVDGHDKHLLEIGPPAIDLLTMGSRKSGYSSVRISNMFGLFLVPALCSVAARRKIVAIAIYRSADDEQGPDGFLRSAAIVALPASAGPAFLVGTTSRSEDAIETAITDVAPALADTVRAARAQLKERGANSLHFFGLNDDNFSDRIDNGDFRVVDYSQRVLEAYRRGVPVDDQDLTYLYNVEKRTWAPTSERSRSQAGYGKF